MCPNGTEEQFTASAHWEMERMQKMDAYIAIRVPVMFRELRSTT